MGKQSRAPIVVPSDLSPRSLAVLPVATRLGAVTALHVMQVPAMMLEDHQLMDRLVEARRAVRRSELLDALDQRECDDIVAVVKHGNPTDEMATWLAEHRDATVVMSSHGRTGINRMLLGSIAERLIRVSVPPVWILKTHAAIAGLLTAHPRFLVAVDPDDGGGKALIDAVTPWARTCSARVDLLSVVNNGPLARRPETVLADLLSNIPEPHRGTTEVRSGRVRERVVEAAKHWNLVVVGSHSSGRLGRMLLGSVSQGVARLAPAVAVVPLNPPQDRTIPC